MIELTMILVCLATFDYKHAPFKAFRVFVSTRCPVRRQGCHARSGLPYRCASGHVFLLRVHPLEVNVQTVNRSFSLICPKIFWI